MWARGIIGLALCVARWCVDLPGHWCHARFIHDGSWPVRGARGGSPRARAQLGGLGRENQAPAGEEPQLMAPDEGPLLEP